LVSILSPSVKPPAKPSENHVIRKEEPGRMPKIYAQRLIFGVRQPCWRFCYPKSCLGQEDYTLNPSHRDSKNKARIFNSVKRMGYSL
jgi:hypothetical protein